MSDKYQGLSTCVEQFYHTDTITNLIFAELFHTIKQV